MATKSYKWFFDLTENLLTKDVTNDYIATVKTLLPKTVDNLADDIVKETAYNRETVIGVITLYDKKIIESVCQGNTVNTGSTLYAPALPGSFIGTDGVVDRTKHKPYVNINPSTGFRKELETVLPVFSGNVLDSGGAHIGLGDRLGHRTHGRIHDTGQHDRHHGQEDPQPQRRRVGHRKHQVRQCRNRRGGGNDRFADDQRSGACHTGRPSQPYGWDHTGWRSKRITATTTHF